MNKLQSAGGQLRTVKKSFTIESEDVILERIAQKTGLIDFDRIGLSSEADQDDLERIKGIGAFTVRKLNALGIYTFQQLANLTSGDIEIVNEAIEYFPGRIERENWVGQSKALLSGETLPIEDDLKVIEGIGPRIEELLKDNGIKTYQQLAGTSIDDLRNMLDSGGSRFKIHNPTTWPGTIRFGIKWQMGRIEKLAG